MNEAMVDNRAANRFELATDGQLAILDYRRKPDALILLHTEVPAALRGKGLGTVLVRAALDAAAREGLRVVPVCAFVKAYLAKHPRS